MFSDIMDEIEHCAEGNQAGSTCKECQSGYYLDNYLDDECLGNATMCLNYGPFLALLLHI